jgi:hypothetical protein
MALLISKKRRKKERDRKRDAFLSRIVEKSDNYSRTRLRHPTLDRVSDAGPSGTSG